MKVMKVDDWHTIDYPEKRVGSVEIKKLKYKRGTYLMEGVAGYDLYELTKPITVTTLQINGSQVMVDDPLHWIGMQKLAENCKGNVLVGGLGLGLIIHHLLKNPAVKKITVVELNKDVIKAIEPELPSGNVFVLNDDIYDTKFEYEQYDTIVLDLWVKGAGEKVRECGTNYKTDLHAMTFKFQTLHPEATVFVWGSRNPKINPAVEATSPEYLEFVKGLDKE